MERSRERVEARQAVARHEPPPIAGEDRTGSTGAVADPGIPRAAMSSAAFGGRSVEPGTEENV
jgi:hypothetical protein